jgi:predicted membrane protein
LARVSRFNIFTIGFLLFLGVFLYWVIPDALTYIGKIGVETLIRFKWVFLGVVILIVLIALWLIYLRYRLAKQTIESQVEVEKYRIKVGVERYGSKFLQLESAQSEHKKTPLVTWDQPTKEHSTPDIPEADRKSTQDT